MGVEISKSSSLGSIHATRLLRLARLRNGRLLRTRLLLITHTEDNQQNSLGARHAKKQSGRSLIQLARRSTPGFGRLTTARQMPSSVRLTLNELLKEKLQRSALSGRQCFPVGSYVPTPPAHPLFRIRLAWSTSRCQE